MTRLRVPCVLAALACITFLGLAPRTSADVIDISGNRYAAIAYSPETGKWGYAHNYGSRSSAERAALAKCKAPDARIVTWVLKGFCALAVGDDQSCWGVGWSYGDGASNVDAKRRALAECNKRTTNARIVVCVCSHD